MRWGSRAAAAPATIDGKLGEILDQIELSRLIQHGEIHSPPASRSRAPLGGAPGRSGSSARRHRHVEDRRVSSA